MNAFSGVLAGVHTERGFCFSKRTFRSMGLCRSASFCAGSLADVEVFPNLASNRMRWRRSPSGCRFRTQPLFTESDLFAGPVVCPDLD